MPSLWNRSGTIERYADDLRAPGARAYFYQGGTTTPFTVYQDSFQSSTHPSPVLTDANGRWPDVFIPYTISFDVQVTSADGAQLTYSIQIPNPNPVDASGTAPPVVEPVTTGMIHAEMINGTKANYVRLNGRGIGTAIAVGANERATGTNNTNSDVFNLYAYLWNNVSNAIAPVAGGRGATPTADFNANKTMTLPDWRGVGPVGLDDMGNSAAGAFSGLTFTVGSAIAAGSGTGSNGITLALINIPPHTHSGGTTSSDGAHTHNLSVSGSATTGSQSVDHTHFISGTTSGESVQHTHTGVTIGQISTSFTAVGSPGRNAFDASTTTSSATGVENVGHTHDWGGTTSGMSASHTHGVTVNSSGTSTSDGGHTHTFTTSTAGGSGGVAVPLNNLGLSRTVTWFIKL